MKLFLPLIFIFLSCQLFGQENVKRMVSKNKLDSIRAIYIKPYPDEFFLWPVLKRRRLDFEMRDLPARNRRVSYRSNKPFSFGMGMFIFEVGLEFTFAVPLAERSKQLFGESDVLDLQVNVFGKTWGVDLYHQQYKGFYITDPSVSIPDNTPYPQRPDISTRNIGLTGYYMFNNKKFSYRSSYNFADRQIKSAGSLAAFASLSGFRARGDSAILGDKYRVDFGLESEIREIKATSLTLVPGYSYNFIYKGFFINATLAFGPAYNRMSYEVEDGSNRQKIEFTTFFAGRVAIGYANDRVFGGVSYVGQGTNARFDNVQLTSSTGTFKALIGYRFREFGFLKKRLVDLPKGIGIGG